MEIVTLASAVIIVILIIGLVIISPICNLGSIYVANYVSHELYEHLTNPCLVIRMRNAPLKEIVWEESEVTRSLTIDTKSEIWLDLVWRM